MAYIIGAVVATVAIAGGLTWYSIRPAQPPASQAPVATPEPSNLPKAAVDFGQQELQPTLVDGVPTYDLVLQRVQWDVGGGSWKEAYTVNGMVPGPTIRTVEGETVRFRVKNEMDEPSSIHWHGIILPPEQDGVAHLTQDPIEPGDSFTYEFKPGPPGTHWYHSHFNGSKQVTMGFYGPFVVVPKDPSHPSHPTHYDREHIIMIGDAGLGLTMSGKSFPYNQPIKVKTGERVLIRLINTGVGNHPMHLHGHDYYIVAKDGNAIKDPPLINTLDIAPGETYDMSLVANNPGSWLYHCHILPHAEGPDGMFGLTALFEYEGYEPDPNSTHRHLEPTDRRLPGTPGKHSS